MSRTKHDAKDAGARQMSSQSSAWNTDIDRNLGRTAIPLREKMRSKFDCQEIC